MARTIRWLLALWCVPLLGLVLLARSPSSDGPNTPRSAGGAVRLFGYELAVDVRLSRAAEPENSPESPATERAGCLLDADNVIVLMSRVEGAGEGMSAAAEVATEGRDK